MILQNEMLYYLSLVFGSMSLDFYQIDITIRKEGSKVTKEVSHTLYLLEQEVWKFSSLES